VPVYPTKAIADVIAKRMAKAKKTPFAVVELTHGFEVRPENLTGISEAPLPATGVVVPAETKLTPMQQLQKKANSLSFPSLKDIPGDATIKLLDPGPTPFQHVLKPKQQVQPKGAASKAHAVEVKDGKVVNKNVVDFQYEGPLFGVTKATEAAKDYMHELSWAAAQGAVAVAVQLNKPVPFQEGYDQKGRKITLAAVAFVLAKETAANFAYKDKDGNMRWLSKNSFQYGQGYDQSYMKIPVHDVTVLIGYVSAYVVKKNKMQDVMVSWEEIPEPKGHPKTHEAVFDKGVGDFVKVK
jgi:hypothetical protein